MTSDIERLKQANEAAREHAHAAVSNTGRRLVIAMDYSSADPREAAARALAVKMGRSDALLTAVDYPRGGLFAVE